MGFVVCGGGRKSTYGVVLNRAAALGVLAVLGVALLGAGLVVGVSLGGDEIVEYPTPEEAVQRYVESTSDFGQAPGIKLMGTLPVWNGVLVLYTSPGRPGTELLGYRLAKHGTSGWRADTGVDFAISATPDPAAVIEWHTDSRADYSSGLNDVVKTAIAFGRLTVGGIAVVEVEFDRGQTHQTVPGSGFFAVAAAGATDVRVIRAIGDDGSVVRVVDRRMVVP